MHENVTNDAPPERPQFWRRVYLAVIFVTFVVITALWAFLSIFLVKLVYETP